MHIYYITKLINLQLKSKYVQNYIYFQKTVKIEKSTSVSQKGTPEQEKTSFYIINTNSTPLTNYESLHVRFHKS